MQMLKAVTRGLALQTAVSAFAKNENFTGPVDVPAQDISVEMATPGYVDFSAYYPMSNIDRAKYLVLNSNREKMGSEIPIEVAVDPQSVNFLQEKDLSARLLIRERLERGTEMLRTLQKRAVLPAGLLKLVRDKGYRVLVTPYNRYSDIDILEVGSDQAFRGIVDASRKIIYVSVATSIRYFDEDILLTILRNELSNALMLEKTSELNNIVMHLINAGGLKNIPGNAIDGEKIRFTLLLSTNLQKGCLAFINRLDAYSRHLKLSPLTKQEQMLRREIGESLDRQIDMPKFSRADAFSLAQKMDDALIRFPYRAVVRWFDVSIPSRHLVEVLASGGQIAALGKALAEHIAKRSWGPILSEQFEATIQHVAPENQDMNFEQESDYPNSTISVFWQTAHNPAVAFVLDMRINLLNYHSQSDTPYSAMPIGQRVEELVSSLEGSRELMSIFAPELNQILSTLYKDELGGRPYYEPPLKTS